MVILYTPFSTCPPISKICIGVRCGQCDFHSPFRLVIILTKSLDVTLSSKLCNRLFLSLHPKGLFFFKDKRKNFERFMQNSSLYNIPPLLFRFIVRYVTTIFIEILQIFTKSHQITSSHERTRTGSQDQYLWISYGKVSRYKTVSTSSCQNCAPRCFLLSSYRISCDYRWMFYLPWAYNSYTLLWRKYIFSSVSSYIRNI